MGFYVYKPAGSYKFNDLALGYTWRSTKGVTQRRYSVRIETSLALTPGMRDA